MDSALPACFRGGAAPSAAGGPSSTTSIYETNLGLAALTWSRTLVGLSLRVDLRLPSAATALDLSSASSAISSTSDLANLTTIRFRLRPWLLWKRRGSRSFHVKDQSRTVDFAWDLSRAVFPPGGSPEPASRFFLAAAVDGEMLLAIGDLNDNAYRKTKTKKPTCPKAPILTSRTEHVILLGSAYTTSVSVAGREREVSIHLAAADKDARMSIDIDGKRALLVKRLRWKFRGNELVELEPAAGVQISWDVHSWLFPNSVEGLPAGVEAPAEAIPELGCAVFVIRFDGEVGRGGRGLWSLQDCESGEVNVKGWRRRRSLLKTRSWSSSASSASSGGGSSVMEWASAEENELKESEGFSLLVYAWRR